MVQMESSGVSPWRPPAKDGQNSVERLQSSNGPSSDTTNTLNSEALPVRTQPTGTRPSKGRQAGREDPSRSRNAQPIQTTETSGSHVQSENDAGTLEAAPAMLPPAYDSFWGVNQ